MASKFLKYLPKSTSFSIPSNNMNTNKAAFSGPIVSIIPQEARRKKANGEAAFGAHEPTSPKVSCIGQVKHKKKKKNVEKKTKKQQAFDGGEESRKAKSKPSVIRKIFLRNKVKEEEEKEEVVVVETAAAEMGVMRKYRSGREMLGDFDWRKVEMEEEEELVAHSAPLVMGGGVPVEVEKRKEVNLWKRRTLALPEPL